MKHARAAPGVDERAACVQVLARPEARDRDRIKAPGTELRVDNGSAYASDDFKEAARLLGFNLVFIQPKTPEDNGVVESFHAGLDRDYLSLVAFDRLDDARQKSFRTCPKKRSAYQVEETRAR